MSSYVPNQIIIKNETGGQKKLKEKLLNELLDYVNKDLKLTESALKKVKITVPPESHTNKIAHEFLEMANAYYQDAKYFYAKNHYIKALAAVNYAHAWLDAGKRLGVFVIE